MKRINAKHVWFDAEDQCELLPNDIIASETSTLHRNKKIISNVIQSYENKNVHPRASCARYLIDLHAAR